DWINAHNRFEATLVDISAATALLAVQGPLAAEILQPLTELNLAAIPYYHFERGTLAGVDNVIVSATGYTGAGGFELYFAAEAAERVWAQIMAAGQPHGLLPAGLGARDTLRLEKAYCLYGNDIDDHRSPLAAGLGWITKLNKSGTFMGSDWLTAEKTAGSPQRLVGFRVEEQRRIPRQSYSLQDLQGKTIGVVTSRYLFPQPQNYRLAWAMSMQGFNNQGPKFWWTWAASWSPLRW
ncbi:MAG: glycine cleavage system aminomethyltransferase GcvT, partial [Lewinella sp.]|nr:glycine cleavage system aminomethyltransferase GcvT [Lewinella sp.]